MAASASGQSAGLEPPHRPLLAWQINQNWRFDPDLLTEAEVQFIADGIGTLVAGTPQPGSVRSRIPGNMEGLRLHR
jgi:hypothetical protein